MKRLLFILTAMTPLLACFSGCQQRYRVSAMSAVKPPVIRQIVRVEPTLPKADDTPVPIDRGEIIHPRDVPSLTPAPTPMTARELALADTGIWFDEAAFEANMPRTMPEPPPARRVQWEFITMEDCPPCVEQNIELSPLRANGWIQSQDEDAHIRELKTDRDDTKGIAADRNVTVFPVLILLCDGNEIVRHEGVTKRMVLVDEFATAVHGLKPLMKAVKPPPMTAGEKQITKEQMDILLNILGKSGPLVLPNSEIVIEQQGITFKIPAGVKANNTVAGSHRRLVFDAASKPSGKWSFLSASADAIVLDVANYTVTAEMPGIIPDQIIKLLKD